MRALGAVVVVLVVVIRTHIASLGPARPHTRQPPRISSAAARTHNPQPGATMNVHHDQSFDDPTAQAAASADLRVIVSYRNYVEAQRTVDRLSDADFPVENLRIVGHGVSTMEAITGRLTNGRAALRGAASGAWFGLFIGLLFGMFVAGAAWLSVLLAGLLIGALWGAIFGFVGHWVTHGHRDFTSVSTLTAERYDIVCTPALAAQAAALVTSRGSS